MSDQTHTDSAQSSLGSNTPSSATPPGLVSTQQVGKYKIEVINNKCIGAASCVALAPGTFQLDEENIAYVVSQTGDDPEMQLLGAQSCPTAAIIITDTQTGKQVWPVE